MGRLLPYLLLSVVLILLGLVFGEGCSSNGDKATVGPSSTPTPTVDHSPTSGSTLSPSSTPTPTVDPSPSSGSGPSPISDSMDSPSTPACKVGPPFSAELYDLTDLGSLGGTESFAYALNDLGQVVGSSRLAGDNETHAFLYQNGAMTDLSPLNSENIKTVGPTGINNFGQIASGVIADGVYSPAVYDSQQGQMTLLGSLGGTGGLSGVATSINNLGQIVGYSYLDGLSRHAFLYSDGVLTDVGSFGGYSSATSINDGGEIVGFSSATANGSANAFIYRNGAMTNISPFDSSESYAKSINNVGQVVGQFLVSDNSAFHAFLYQQGVATDIYVSGTESDAYAINNAGTIVGHFLLKVGTVVDHTTGQTVDTCDQHAFVYAGGVMFDLNNLVRSAPNWVLKWAYSVNEQGQIAGYGQLSGINHAYLLTPIYLPEP